MSALDYLRLIRRGWRIALGCLLAVSAIGVVLTTTATRQYRADTRVFVSATGTTTDANQLALANTYVQARVQSYLTIASSPMVTKAVVRDLHLARTSDDLAAQITASAPTGTVVLTIAVLDPDPKVAARIADAVAARFVTVVEAIERTDPKLASPVDLTVTAPAPVPTAAASPNVVLNVGLAVVFGAVLGIGLALLRGMLDTSLDDAEGLAAVSGLPVLGTIPRGRGTSSVPLAVTSGATDRRAEAYRQLRTNLQYVAVDEPPRVIAITSAVAGEGKTSTALNLAAALAETGVTVWLVEADLRRPTLAATLGLVAEVGLTSVLVGSVALDDAVQQVSPRLTVLTSGPVPPNPSELLDSAQARALLATAAERCDFVLIDTAPLLPVTDGAEVASRADATLLVVRAGRTKLGEVAAAIDVLTKVGVQPVGAVLNGAAGAR